MTVFSNSRIAKMLSLLSVLLLAAGVQARQPARQGPIQSITEKPLHPQTFSVNADASVVRPADIAAVEFSINVDGSSREQVTLEAKNHLSDLDETFAGLLRHGAIEDFNIRGFKIRDRGMSRNYGYKDETPDLSFNAYASAKARFTDFDAMRRVQENLANSSSITTDWINWELSPTNSAAARKDVRREAIKAIIAAGQDYADVFEVSEYRLVEINEQSIYEYSEFEMKSYQFDQLAQSGEGSRPAGVRIAVNSDGKFALGL